VHISRIQDIHNRAWGESLRTCAPINARLLSWAVSAAVFALYLSAFRGLSDFDLLLTVQSVMGIVALLAVLAYLEEVCRVRLRLGMIMVGAVLFRLLFLFQPPVLSDDIYRYLWDGTRLVAGENPYARSPAEEVPETAEEADVLARVNHPDLITIYPPMAQAVFWAGAVLGGSTAGMKAVFCSFDLATCVLLFRLLSRLGLPVGRAVLYAWNPLPVIETAGSGHVDAVAVFFLVLSLSVILQRETTARSWEAGAAFSLSFMTKLFPVIFLPAILARMRCRMAFLGAAGCACSLLAIPFLPELLRGIGTLGHYLGSWEFGGLAYKGLVWLGLSGRAARIVLAGALGAFALAVAARLALREDVRPLSLVRALFATALVWLLLTPTLHPWYVLPLVPFAAISAQPAGIVFSASVLISYAVLVPYTACGVWTDSASTAFFVTAAAVFALVLPPFIEGIMGPARKPDRASPLGDLVDEDQRLGRGEEEEKGKG